jgi:uncharacterized protein
MNLPEEAVTFECCGEPLVAVLHRASSTGNPGVIVVVGGPQYRVGSHRQFVLLARALAQAGYPVLRFDYRGMGDGGGDARSFEQAGDDIRAAIDLFLRSVPGMPAIVLWGLCDAASAILMHAAGDARVGALVLVNPWVRTDRGEAKAYVQRYYGQRLLQRSFWRKLASGRLDIVAALRSFAKAVRDSRGPAVAANGPAIGEHFIARMLRGLQGFAGPVLMLISENDLTAAEFVSLCREDRRWQKASARDGVQMVSLAGADHTFSSRVALDDATARCVSWLRAALPAAVDDRVVRSPRVRSEA